MEVSGQPVHLPAQVHVLEQRVGECLELRALFGAHRVQCRLDRRHLGRELSQELVEVLRVTGEKIAELLHELLEARVQRFALLTLLDHPVEGVERLTDPFQVLGVGIGQSF